MRSTSTILWVLYCSSNEYYLPEGDVAESRPIKVSVDAANFFMVLHLVSEDAQDWKPHRNANCLILAALEAVCLKGGINWMIEYVKLQVSNFKDCCRPGIPLRGQNKCEPLGVVCRASNEGIWNLLDPLINFGNEVRSSLSYKLAYICWGTFNIKHVARHSVLHRL